VRDHHDIAVRVDEPELALRIVEGRVDRPGLEAGFGEPAVKLADVGAMEVEENGLLRRDDRLRGPREQLAPVSNPSVA
jgi:hypothetical protein